ncbi:MAG: hypothetical protein IJP67_05395 [Oscillospiraceae bacterium]|nr:hypothetical protein [Oscillospiraceae bacterium]
MIWMIFAIAAALLFFGRKSFAFDAISAIICAFAVLFGLYSGLLLTEILPPAVLYCALTLLRGGGGEK